MSKKDLALSPKHPQHLPLSDYVQADMSMITSSRNWIPSVPGMPEVDGDPVIFQPKQTKFSEIKANHEKHHEKGHNKSLMINCNNAKQLFYLVQTNQIVLCPDSVMFYFNGFIAGRNYFLYGYVCLLANII